MATQPKTFTTAAEYLTADRAASCRSEYLAGQVFPVEAAPAAHALIVVNLSGELRAATRHTNCTVYASSLRVRSAATNEYAYPDVVLVCGQPIFADPETDILSNPTAIIEVLSKSTADYDRGGKFRLYKSIPSVKEYCMVSQTEMLVEYAARQADGSWLSRDITSAASTVTLAGAQIKLAEIYAKVEFPPNVPVL